MNSPAISDRCPKCLSAVTMVTQYATYYACLSQVLRGGIISEAPRCIGNQRDQLAERVKRLEEAGNALIDAIQSVQCWNETHVGECINQFESWRGSQ